MGLPKISEIMPVIENLHEQYASITTDGCYFYLLNKNNNKISQFNLDFNYIKSFKTIKKYKSICYDFEENCFFACRNKPNNYIYKLDKNFNEIDFIKLNFYDPSNFNIKTISYNRKKNNLIVNFGNMVFDIDKYNLNEYDCKFKVEDNEFTSIIFLYNNYICSFKNNFSDNINVFSLRNKFLLQCNLPNSLSLVDFVYFKQDYCTRENEYIYILAKKNNSYFYVLKCVIDNNNKEEECKNYYEIEKILCYKNQFEELEKSNIDFYEPIEEIENKIKDFKDEKIKCSCRCCVCKYCYEDCIVKYLDKSCIDIIESIALIERSISYILNAEGKKIQKVLEYSCCIEDILNVNDSVRKTISKITYLEHALYSKLEIIKKINPCNFDCNFYKIDK